MADTLTPERVQQIQAEIGRQVRMRGVKGAKFYMRGIEPDELRALLRCYQRQQETCEWRIVGDVGFLTDCGRAPGDEDLYASCPCWCGRKVQVTR